MTFAEALAVLGIDARTDARAGRRAYLRKVKEFKPERDPDGFQRVRAAWEIVEPRLDEPAEEPEPRAPLAPPTPMRVVRWNPEARAVEPPSAAEPPPPRPPEPPPPDDGPAPWSPPESPDLSKFVLHFAPPPVEPDALPDPAPWDAPPEADAEGWTVEPLPDDPLGPAPIPRDLPPFERRASPRELVEEAFEAAPIDADLALDALRRGLSAAAEGHRPEPDLRVAVNAVLALHRAGAPNQARQAWDALRRWIDDTGAGTRLSGTVAAWLALCRELSDLPVRFPPAVRRRLAEAMLDQDLAAAEADLLELYRTVPHVAIDAAELLDQHAPNLAKLYGASLRDPAGNQQKSETPPEEGGKGGLGASLLVYLAILVASIALRVCVADGPSSSPPAFHLPPPMPLQLEPWQLPPPALDLDTSYRAEVALQMLCMDLYGEKSACGAGEAALRATREGDCGAARAAVEPWRAAAASAGPETLDSGGLMRQIVERVDARCPTPEEPPVDP